MTQSKSDIMFKEAEELSRKSDRLLLEADILTKKFPDMLEEISACDRNKSWHKRKGLDLAEQAVKLGKKKKHKAESDNLWTQGTDHYRESETAESDRKRLTEEYTALWMEVNYLRQCGDKLREKARKLYIKSCEKLT